MPTITTAPKIAVVSLTSRNECLISERRERYIFKQHSGLAQFLRNKGVDVVDPMPEIRKGWNQIYGLNRHSEIERYVSQLRSENIDGLVVGCWSRTDSQLLAYLVNSARLPTALYTDDESGWGGCPSALAGSAALREAGGSHAALTHHRIRSDKDELLSWVQGVHAYSRLKRSALLIWGAHSGEGPEIIQEDIAALKAALVGRVYHEDELSLTTSASAILKKRAKRLEAALNWFKRNGAKLKLDRKGFSRDIFMRQAALYLAARERLQELEEEGVVGCTTCCWDGLRSVWGTTACLLPALLPFSRDWEGPKSIVPTVCRRDLKSLATSVLLHGISPLVPPLFGEVRHIGSTYWVLGNCGGASIYYAANSRDVSHALAKTSLLAHGEGCSGGAVCFNGRQGALTIAQLVRLSGEYVMQIASVQANAVRNELRAKLAPGRSWPIHSIRLKCGMAEFFEIAGSAHFCATQGDVTRQLQHACRAAGIRTVRIDDEAELRAELKRRECLRPAQH